MTRFIIIVLALATAEKTCAAGAHDAPRFPLRMDDSQRPPIARPIATSSVAFSVGDCLNESARLRDTGKNKEALVLLEGCVRKAPEQSGILSALAWAYFQKGDLRRAKARFIKAEIKGGQADSLNLLGLARIAIEEKRFGEALDILKTLSGKRPLLALVDYYRGMAFEGMAKREDAISAYQNVLRKDSHFVEVRFSLAALFESLGKIDDAWREYAKILTVDPMNRTALAGRDRLGPRLTRKPQEIIPPKVIERHASVQPAPHRDTSPIIKIGIGTSPGGNSLPQRTVAFQASGPFAIAGQPSNKTLAKGSANEPWAVRIATHDRSAAEILDPSGRVAAAFHGSAIIKPAHRGSGTIIIRGISFAPGYPWGGNADRELRGDIEVAISHGRGSLSIINHVPLDEYVYGVLNSEMPSRWPTEALKAQAVLARTQALYRQRISNPHKGTGYDLCDEQHCQVYGGVAAETSKGRDAADSTRGVFLAHNGRPAHTIFSSNCGGSSESGRDIGWGDEPYWQAIADGDRAPAAGDHPWRFLEWLKGEPSAYCNANGLIGGADFRWSRVVSARDLESRVFRIKPIGRLKGLIPVKRSRSGRVTALKFVGASGEVVLTQEHKIRRNIGLGPLRSTLFSVETTYRGGQPQTFTIFGGGWGHGVGMCQAGAGGRAEKGSGYKDILAHYYPGTKPGTAGDK